MEEREEMNSLARSEEDVWCVWLADALGRDGVETEGCTKCSCASFCWNVSDV